MSARRVWRALARALTSAIAANTKEISTSTKRLPADLIQAHKVVEVTLDTLPPHLTPPGRGVAARACSALRPLASEDQRTV